MNFMNAIENETKKQMTYTENGALAYATSGKNLLDFLFSTTALRAEPEDEIFKRITRFYFDDPVTANKFMFWQRDCRGGNGERKIFRAYLKWLAKNKPEVAKVVIELVPYYGRWDDLWVLLDTDLKDDVIELIRDTIKADLNAAENKGNNCSLLGKWLKSENTSSKESRRIAGIIRNGLGLTPRQYRKTLARMRQYLDVVEVKTSANRWSEINYEAVPSQANIKYTDSFMRHDAERRTEYLESLKKGDAKINASVLQPHEIVNKYMSGWCVKQYDEALEQLWKALPVKSIDNTLVVRDGSGSMTGGYNTKVRPIDVATALAIYMADHNHGVWEDKFITFSANPEVISLEGCKDLHDKLSRTYDEDDCTNTDIEKTMILILDTAKSNHCSQEDMPKNIVIVSDMGFDVGTRQAIRNSYGFGYTSVDVKKSLFDDIADAYEEAGYKLPRIIFWNVAGEIKNGVPMQQNDMGVVLMSGFSVQLLDMVMSGETDPYRAVLETINSPRYQAVEDAVKDIV
jgi:hypothetical protein